MLFSIISVLVGCSGGEKEATETPATPAATEAAPVVPAATEPCVDSTPDDGVDNCAKETATLTVEAATTQPTVVVVAK